MQAALEKLQSYETVILWVLEGMRVPLPSMKSGLPI